MTVRIATAAYPNTFLESWADYERKIGEWVAEAANNGAEILLFPEYGCMELATLAGAATASDLEASIDAVSQRLGDADALHAELSRRHGVYICAASGPCRVEASRRPVNRARFFAPSGKAGYQDKLVMTRFEREEWNIAAGAQTRVFDTPHGRIGIAICYDSEFPLVAHAMADAGAEILLVPSATEALAGYWRVRIGAQARALENQCIAVHAPIVGAAEWSPAIDISRGAAGIYCPPDKGFPETGVLAIGKMDKPGWVYGDVSLDAIREVRADGNVLNLSDWKFQDERIADVEIVEL